MEAIRFFLFLGWSCVVYKIPHAQGQLSGGRDGARALARYIQQFKMQDLDAINSYVEQIDIKKVLKTFDRGGKPWSSYGSN